MIEPGPPPRVEARACVPDGEGGEICARAVDRVKPNGWLDARERAFRLAREARRGEGNPICERCETNLVLRHDVETDLCRSCRRETGEVGNPFTERER